VLVGEHDIIRKNVRENLRFQIAVHSTNHRLVFRTVCVAFVENFQVYGIMAFSFCLKVKVKKSKGIPLTFVITQKDKHSFRISLDEEL
jgi:hypothetical protein